MKMLKQFNSEVKVNTGQSGCGSEIFSKILEDGADRCVAILHYYLGMAEISAGLLNEAEVNLQLALIQLLQWYPEAHPVVASVIHTLYKLCGKLGKFENALCYRAILRKNFYSTLLDFDA